MKPVFSLFAALGITSALAAGLYVSAQETKPPVKDGAVKDGPAKDGPAKEAPAKAGAAKEAGVKGETGAKGDEKKKVQVPPFFGKIDLTSAQREKIYAIQAGYNEKLEALKNQIKALDTQRDADCEAVLTAEQKERLTKAIADSKKKSADKAAEKKKEIDAKKETETKKPGEAKSEGAAKAAAP